MPHAQPDLSTTHGALDLYWGDDLRALADTMADTLQADPAPDPFQHETVVLGSRVLAGWLRSHLVLDRGPAARQRVIANWDLQFLHVFVNDWLHRLAPHCATAADPRPPDPPGLQAAPRDPFSHPYSPQVLQWRIDRLLRGPLLTAAPAAVLRTYLGPDAPALRRFQLAGAIARLMDEYQVYRPDLLTAWERPGPAALPAAVRDDRDQFLWQPELWRLLLAEHPGSYLAQFRDMDQALDRAVAAADPACDPRRLGRVAVFGISHMPVVYLAFFRALARHIPVRVYTFNPCRDYWQQDLDARDAARIALRLQGRAEPEDLHIELGNPLLSAWGKANQQFLTELSHYADEPEPEAGCFRPDPAPDAPLLARLQSDIRNRRIPTPNPAAADDDSIRIAICHSPLREVEVLRDQLLYWFSQPQAGPGGRQLQPRDVQVQLADMATYMPYVDAVFATIGRHSPSTIPYVVADRFVVGESRVARAFFSLLGLPRSRFTAPEVLDLLECPAIQLALDLTPADVSQLRAWTSACAIRWGLDAPHRQDRSDADFEATGTWEQGLQRMILGLVTGADGPDGPDSVWTLADGTRILPFETAEGHGAALVGTLARFLADLRAVHVCMQRTQPLAAWRRDIDRWVGRLFASTNETFQDLLPLQRAIDKLDTIDRAADLADAPIPGDVIATFLQDQISQAEAQDNLAENAVVFSALRPMSSTPRRVQYLLGLSEGDFPRQDNRPQFDLIARDPHRVDPLRRWQDRQAMLEAVMCAGQQLTLSYVGRSADQNEPLPPATVVAELRDYLSTHAGLAEDPASHLLPVERLHRLQAFHPAYFSAADDTLFSHSRPDLAAARVLAAAATPTPRRAPEPAVAAGIRARYGAGAPRDTLSLAQLDAFYRNPAQVYCVQTLKIRLKTDDLAVLDDAETFELDGLQAYQVREAILAASLTIADPTAPPESLQRALHERLKQQGLLPLGRPGWELLLKLWHDLAVALANPVESRMRSWVLHELLRLPAQRLQVQQPIADTRLDSTLALRRDGDLELLVSCSTSDMKAKHRLQAWLQHLAACAAGRPVHSIVISAKKDKPVLTAFTPVAPDSAAAQLAGLLAYYQHWQILPMPFAPASSHAYWKALQKNGPDDVIALSAAVQKQWQSSWGDSRSDADDPYMRHAFGPDGPYAYDPDTFAAIARGVFTPLERSAAGQPAEPDPEDAP